ncbi:type IV toxin-antitoxin system AbiEi family antitoxin domain-containing protein [Bradyrhizobium diversitatis]|nr:type IV toxin-antitoxin system AbiEi family antitoxin domain-containing protein [Bradyrhizobium diversitatis]
MAADRVIAERALLELLKELPNSESFHQADMLVEGLRNLSPRKLQKLLDDCRSVKVKKAVLLLTISQQDTSCLIPLGRWRAAA